MLSCWLREPFLTPLYKTSTILPEHACGVWDFHQAWGEEAALQNYEVRHCDFRVLARLGYSTFLHLDGSDFIDASENKHPC